MQYRSAAAPAPNDIAQMGPLLQMLQYQHAQSPSYPNFRAVEVQPEPPVIPVTFPARAALTPAKPESARARSRDRRHAKPLPPLPTAYAASNNPATASATRQPSPSSVSKIFDAAKAAACSGSHYGDNDRFSDVTGRE